LIVFRVFFMASILELPSLNRSNMIRNYITIALRSILRHKTYSIINVAGLSVGIACCLLLALYIQDEVSFDRHHHDADRIYRVLSLMGENADRTMHTTSAPIVWGIKEELPEIETVARLVNPPGVSQNLIKYEDKQFYESKGYIADSTLFDIFTYNFKEGNPKNCLVEANSIVITERLAKKFFGNEPALNKVINVNQSGPSADFRITGVLSETQKNTEIEANFFVSMTSSGWAEYLRSPAVIDQWAGQNFLLSYIKLKPGTNPTEFIPKMNKVFLKYGSEDLKALGMKKQLGLFPLKDIYLHAAYGDSSPRITYLYVIASIAVFILLIACINFMNLSTAKATKRANEVGLRKTLGAYKSSLIVQFLGEAMVIVLFAIIVSLGLVQLLLPLFNQVTLKAISFGSDNIYFFLSALIAIAVITGLAAGSYPAFYLSSFQPAKVLKGKTALNQSGSLLRKGLVVFQFVVAITLVCGVIMISKQLAFMQEKDLGFESDNKIVLPLRSETARKSFAGLRDELSTFGAVKDVTGSNYVPGSHIWHDFTLFPEGSSMEKGVMIKNVMVEPNFIDVMKLKIVAGRNFTENREADSQNKVILNTTAVKRLGFEPAELAGHKIYSDRNGERNGYEVIGVMEDYHHISVKEEIFPILYFLESDIATHNFMIVDIEDKKISEAIQFIETSWKKMNADTPFEYTFLDDNIKKQYDEDQRVAKVITSFTIIAMIISCLGLYGLSTFMAERRFKEIGVRKVMGASVSQIVQMMSGEFIKLVAIAFFVAVPLSYYFITTWLENFAYKAPVTLSIFTIAGTSALLIAVLTVSFESVQAASKNPVNALRNE
jgi:putative ABC transport system permease protein